MQSNLVDLIFAKCNLIYGRDFSGRWEGLDLDEVKADWARELGGLLNSPAAIRHGLERLNPDKPPNVLQFKALCIGAPGDTPRQVLAITGPEPTPEDKERVRSMLAGVRAKLTGAA